MKFYNIVSSILLIFLLGCGTVKVTKQEAFPSMYTAEKPTSILVVPAVNKTTAADAAQLYATTIAKPLAESGYYVFSIPFIQQFFNREGIVDGTQINNIPPAKFKELFGADAVLFVTINQWDTNYYVVGGNVTVGAHFKLVSTSSNQTLWQYNDVYVHNTSGDSGGGIIGALISTAIATAATDYVSVANVVNTNIINSMPLGKYHSRHNQDGKDAGVVVSKAK